MTALEKSVIGVAGASGVGRTSLLESFAKIGRTTGVSIEQEEPVLIEVNKNISVLDTIGELELTTSPLVLKGKEKGSHSGALVE
ncbi:MAG: hypothetical protein JST59_00710 [Actinobacteria bacterium]|nr:hypothetical protein [Actinomycetota bacterium]